MGRHATPIFGATAADQWRFEGTRQFYGLHVLEDAVPFVLLAGDIRFSFAVKPGWSPLGRQGVVSEAEGNVVKVIDGQPATAGDQPESRHSWANQPKTV